MKEAKKEEEGERVNFSTLISFFIEFNSDEGEEDEFFFQGEKVDFEAMLTRLQELFASYGLDGEGKPRVTDNFVHLRIRASWMPYRCFSLLFLFLLASSASIVDCCALLRMCSVRYFDVPGLKILPEARVAVLSGVEKIAAMSNVHFILVHDALADPDTADDALLKLLRQKGLPTINVVNKVNRLLAENNAMEINVKRLSSWKVNGSFFFF